MAVITVGIIIRVWRVRRLKGVEPEVIAIITVRIMIRIYRFRRVRGVKKKVMLVRGNNHNP